MIYKHNCLAGGEQLGDAWDCVKCRAQLLKAFRSPPVIPEEEERARLRHPSSQPHLMIPPERTRTVPLSPDPEEEVSVHATSVSTTPFNLLPGGAWIASCACGWKEQGHWTSGQSEGWARGQAEAAADMHNDQYGD